MGRACKTDNQLDSRFLILSESSSIICQLSTVLYILSRRMEQDPFKLFPSLLVGIALEVKSSGKKSDYDKINSSTSTSHLSVDDQTLIISLEQPMTGFLPRGMKNDNQTQQLMIHPLSLQYVE